MDSSNNLQTTGGVNDLSALSWVHEELRRSVESALKSLRRCLKEIGAAAGVNIDSVDPAALHSARQHLHQAAGGVGGAGRGGGGACSAGRSHPPPLTGRPLGVG